MVSTFLQIALMSVVLVFFCRAQFVLVMLVLFTLTLPLLVLAYVSNKALAVVLTVITVTTYWTVNEVARDVEDPFLYSEQLAVCPAPFTHGEI